MSMTDPIADFLTRIRNGIMANKVDIVCPRSKIKLKLAEILKDEGFVDAVSKSDDSVQGSIAVTLRYDNRHNSGCNGQYSGHYLCSIAQHFQSGCELQTGQPLQRMEKNDQRGVIEQR